MKELKSKISEKIESLAVEMCLRDFFYRFEDEFWYKIRKNNFKRKVQQIFRDYKSVFKGACKNYGSGSGCRLLSDYSYLINFFDEQTALDIMSNTSQESLFIFFGYHTIIREYDDIQVRWLNTSARFVGVNYSIMLPNITDNAIRAVDPDIAYDFLSLGFQEFVPGRIKLFIVPSRIKLFMKKIKNIKLDTVKQIVFIKLLSDSRVKDYDSFMIEFLKYIKK